MNAVLWGTRKGSPDWDEEIITVTGDTARLDRAREWAQSNGFRNLRTMEDDGNPPDFMAAIK